MRQALPNRRAHEVFSFEFWGQRFYAGIGRATPSAPIHEVWINVSKSGTQSETLARDSAVILSIALQYGVPIQDLRHAVMRDLDGVASGPIGRLLDIIDAGDTGEAVLSDAPRPSPSPVAEYSDA